VFLVTELGIMKTMKKILAVFFLTLFTAVWIHAATYTVGHPPGAYDYNTLTDALSVAISGDTILVADGTYNALGVSYQEIFPLVMKEGVILKRATGDILPTIDAQRTGRVFNCEYISSSSETRIEGFLITGGKVDYGGGMYFDEAKLTITGCAITSNIDEYSGGGIYCDDN